MSDQRVTELLRAANVLQQADKSAYEGAKCKHCVHADTERVRNAELAVLAYARRIPESAL